MKEMFSRGHKYVDPGVTTIRLSKAEWSAVHNLRDSISAQTIGVKISMSDALRACIDAGLVVLAKKLAASTRRMATRKKRVQKGGAVT